MVDEISSWAFILVNYGFSTMVAIYLLVRFEKKIENLTNAINQLINTMKQKKD